MATAPQLTIAQQNYINRQNLIQNGLHMVKQLQPVSGPVGALPSTLRVPLERMGIMTGIMLEVTVPVTIAVAVPVPSAFGPYNLVKGISYTDYAGLQRVLTSGYQLHVLNCMRGETFMNNANVKGYLGGVEGAVDTDILGQPTETGEITFSLFVPIAYDAKSDLRGAVLSQTIYGDHYVTLNFADNFLGTDSLQFPYVTTAGETVTVTAGQSVTVQAFQHYIMPQQGVANLPMIDLSTVYAIEGGYQDSANVVAGQSKYINWPNNRAIMSATHIFDQAAVGGTLNGADINRIVLLGNSNTNIRELTPRYLRNEMRYKMGGDFPSGVYFMNSRSQPITTQLYGNVQTRFDIQTAGAGSYFLSQYESTYMSGTPLPGVIQ